MSQRNNEPQSILLVEDLSDKRLISHLREMHGNLPDFHIRRCRGWGGLKREIRLQIDVDDRLMIGIIADADDELSTRWSDICQEVQRAQKGTALPAQPEFGGTIVGGKPRIGIWIMPDNRSQGELEDFVAAMVPEDDPIWPLAMNYIDTIPPEHRRFLDHKVQKARVYAWTATLKSPGGLLSAATSEANLNVDSENCLMLISWLRQLFSDEDKG